MNWIKNTTLYVPCSKARFGAGSNLFVVIVRMQQVFFGYSCALCAPLQVKEGPRISSLAKYHKRASKLLLSLETAEAIHVGMEIQALFSHFSSCCPAWYSLRTTHAMPCALATGESLSQFRVAVTPSVGNVSFGFSMPCFLLRYLVATPVASPLW